MAYSSLEQCLLDLEKNGHLKRVTEEVDPFLEMATIHHRVYESGGPALLFENVKGSSYRAASNIFGSLERSKFIFRHSLEHVQKLIRVKQDPISAFNQPLTMFGAGLHAINALPLKNPIQKPIFF